MVKRVFDILVTLACLPVLLPVMAVVSLAIKLSSPGSIFYRAQRVGRNGRPFVMLKFRTMADGLAGDTGPRVTAKNDPRITRIGRVLRNSKLNELPQFLNVLKGDMSLVGPRPEDPEFVAHYSAEEQEVLSVRPGITSPASILYCREEELLSFGTETESYLRDVLPSKLRLDLLYVRRRSFLLDLDVLLRTVLALIPMMGRSAPEWAEIVAGPVQRLVRQSVPWFAIDLVTAAAAIGLAGLMWRAAGPLHVGWGPALALALGMALCLSLSNHFLGLQRTAWRYAGSQELLDLVFSAALTTAVLVVADRLPARRWFLPPAMLLVAGVLALIGFTVTRYGRRLLDSLAYRWARFRRALNGRERALMIGAGETGRWMVALLQAGGAARAIDIVGIVDDDPWMQGARIHGVRVLGDRSHIPELVKQYEVGLIVYGIHNIDPAEQEAILGICRATPARVVVIPDIARHLTQPPVGEAAEGAKLPKGGEVTMAWLAELESLLASGRSVDAQRRVREMRARLGARGEEPAGLWDGLSVQMLNVSAERE